MSKTTDVIVVGSGLSGLMAALTAASNNCRVRVISQGMGCLAISAGVIDVLGYDAEGRLLSNPFDGFKLLPPKHPYTLLGADNVRNALEAFATQLLSQGLKIHSATDVSGQPENVLLPTIMGTLKPTYMYQDDIDASTLINAKKILVVSVKGFRDCKPQLVINQLRRYKAFEDCELTPLILPEPFSERGRSINALDIARFADRQNGGEWLLNMLKGRGDKYDLILMPPMLGATSNSTIRKRISESLGCPYIEMLCVPPGVGGLRIRQALINRLNELNVEFYENAEVIHGDIRDGKCVNLTVSASGKKVLHQAKAFVIATGGIISGGIELQAGKVQESIFGLDIPVPENVDEWTEGKLFGDQLVSQLGVKVDCNMRPVDCNENIYMNNVFFAGRSLGGYDYAKEKSGHGVAVSTGWKAGQMAAELASQENK